MCSFRPATEVPRTQNPLFKRRLTLTSTAQPPRTTTTFALETTTTLYAQEEDDDQVAKSSIHTSRFNQIPQEQVHPRVNFEQLPVTSTSSSSSTSTAAPPLPPYVASSTRK